METYGYIQRTEAKEERIMGRRSLKKKTKLIDKAFEEMKQKHICIKEAL